MPWQRLIADVGGELDPETGLPAYREVIFTVPRQSGKTTLILSWEIQRAHSWGQPQKIAYSAQSGNDARKKLVEDQIPLLWPRRKPLGISNILRGMGNEAVEFHNGSRIVLLASTEDSGHGKTIDLGVKDELFADSDDRRDQALIPAMATRSNAQVLTASTAGTEDSVPLNQAVDRGRLAVELDQREGIAYFEWSADPDADPSDPNTWAQCMPALGYTITPKVVSHAQKSMTEGEFARAFLNLRTKADNRIIPIDRWKAVVSREVEPVGAPTYSLDVNPDRSAGAIVAASPGVAELIEFRPKIGWIIDRAIEINQKNPGAGWVIDSAGPGASMIVELERAGLNVIPATPRQLVSACGQFYDSVLEGKVSLRYHPALDEAAAGATKRVIGDAWAWTRKNAASDICPLVAATLALWGAGNVTNVAANVW